MNTYLANWPDGSISVIQADGEVNLFLSLDEEGPPLEAKIYILPKFFHLKTNLNNEMVEAWVDDYDLEEFQFDENIVEYALKSINPDLTKEQINLISKTIGMQ